jgi:hypothetical protein
MIGNRAPITAAATGLALVLGLGGGAPRPELELAARATVLDHAGAAEAALTTLRERLDAALDAGRTGSASVVAGDAAPGPMFDRAADEALAAVDVAIEALVARDALAAARSVSAPDAAVLPPAPDPAEIAAVGVQLEDTAAAAEEFVTMRGRAESVTPTLLAALDALEAGEIEGSEGLVAEARAALVAVERWEVGVTLPVWTSTVDKMIGAMQRLVAATSAGDAAGAEAAAAEFDALAEEAPEADRALRIALDEGGTAVGATALERLAALLAATDDLRLAVIDARRAAGG